MHWRIVENSLAWLYDDVLLIIYYLLKFLARYIQQCAYLVGQRTEEPDMGNRNREFDMTHTLAAYLFLCDFNATTVAHDALVANTFVFTAVALPIAGRSEYTLTEQTVALGFQCAVVDGLRFRDLTIRAFLD